MSRIGQILMMLLFGTTLTFGQFKSIDKLDIKISQKHTYVAGQPISVRLTILNPTDSVRTIEFTETHKYHKKLPFPTCISASIEDDKGNIQCIYNSQYFLWSTLFVKEDLQYVKIKPGDKLIRDLEINEIVSGCICFQDKGFKPGTYFVTLSVHDRLTEELKIEVR